MSLFNHHHDILLHDDIRSGVDMQLTGSPELCRPCWADTGELKRLLPHNRVECSDPVSTLQYLQCSHLSPTWVLNLLATDERLRSADTDNAPHWHLLHHQKRDFFWIPRTSFEGLGHGRGAWWQHGGIAATTVIGSRSGEQRRRILVDDCIISRDINKRIGHSFSLHNGHCTRRLGLEYLVIVLQPKRKNKFCI